LSHLQQEKICETKSFINVKQKSVEMKNKCFVWLMAILLMVPIGLSAQEITVKGNVTDSTGEGVIGASVVERVMQVTERLPI
jgi:hypothetical protein